MSSGFETIEVIDPWLYQTLSGDEELASLCGADRIVSELSLSEELSSRPYVTWQRSSERDVVAAGSGSTRIWADALYHVRGIVKGTSYMPVLPVAKRIEALIHEARITTEFGYLVAVREQIVQYPENSGSTQFRHLGGIYRFRAHTT